MRVNARLDEATQQQLQYLIEATGQNASLVLRESVAQYYVQVKRQQRAPSRFLALAGTGRSGLGDVSTNVKQYVAEALAQKYPQRTGSQKTGAQHSGAQAVVARPVAKQRKAGIA